MMCCWRAAPGNLAAIYMAKWRWKDAEPLLKRALLIYEKHPASNASVLAKVLDGLAEVGLSKNEHKNAEELYLRALSVREKAPSWDHEEIVHSLNNLAEFYLRQKQYAQAKPMLQRMIKMKEQKLGEKDAQVGRLLERMACVMYRNNEKAEADEVEARANHILYSDLAAAGKVVSLPLAIFSCKLLNNPRPDFARLADHRRLPLGINTMEVAVETDEAGNVIVARLTSGNPALKAVAEKAALGAKLRPTIVDGRAVRVEGAIRSMSRAELRMTAPGRLSDFP